MNGRISFFYLLMITMSESIVFPLVIKETTISIHGSARDGNVKIVKPWLAIDRGFVHKTVGFNLTPYARDPEISSIFIFHKRIMKETQSGTGAQPTPAA